MSVTWCELTLQCGQRVSSDGHTVTNRYLCVIQISPQLSVAAVTPLLICIKLSVCQLSLLASRRIAEIASLTTPVAPVAPRRQRTLEMNVSRSPWSLKSLLVWAPGYCHVIPRAYSILSLLTDSRSRYKRHTQQSVTGRGYNHSDGHFSPVSGSNAPKSTTNQDKEVNVTDYGVLQKES